MRHGLDGEAVREKGVIAPFLLGLPSWLGASKGQAFLSGEREDRCGHGTFPEKIPDKVILADTGAEIVDSGRVSSISIASQRVEVRPPEHVRFADYTGRDGDGGDGGVEFCVGGREEELFEQASHVVGVGPSFACLRSNVHYER